jgi:hypothetical protein
VLLFRIVFLWLAFTTNTYSTVECTGPPLVYDDDFYSSSSGGGGGNVTCYYRPADTADPTDPFAVTEQYITLQCVSSSSSSDGSDKCFSAASSSILLSSGRMVLLSEVVVGDFVEVVRHTTAITACSAADTSSADSDSSCGTTGSSSSAFTGVDEPVVSGYNNAFSEVVAVPHRADATLTRFVRISVAGDGQSDATNAQHSSSSSSPSSFVSSSVATVTVTVTPHHLLPVGACESCDDDISKAVPSLLPLVEAQSVRVGECVYYLMQQSLKQPRGVRAAPRCTVVTAVDHNVYERGAITVVTGSSKDLLVVNGVVASPFAVSHWLPNFYYNIHRILLRSASTSRISENGVSNVFGTTARRMSECFLAVLDDVATQVVSLVAHSMSVLFSAPISAAHGVSTGSGSVVRYSTGSRI